MKKLLGCMLVLAALPVGAKDKLIPLAQTDAAALQGKTVALTVHDRPTFVAMTAGKAGFGILGVAGMVKSGNTLIDQNHVADPASIVRDNISSALRDAFGVQLLPVDTSATNAKKPAEIAATHPEAAYVLDVRSNGWNYGYFAAKWGTYWIGYSVQVQLVDTRTGRQVSNAACNADTRANPNPPSRDQIHANGAKLLKDVTSALGWMCVQLLAKEQFHVASEKVATTPPQYVNPLAPQIATPNATAVADTNPNPGKVISSDDVPKTSNAGMPVNDDAKAPLTSSGSAPVTGRQ